MSEIGAFVAKRWFTAKFQLERKSTSWRKLLRNGFFNPGLYSWLEGSRDSVMRDLLQQLAMEFIAQMKAAD